MEIKSNELFDSLSIKNKERVIFFFSYISRQQYWIYNFSAKNLASLWKVSEATANRLKKIIKELVKDIYHILPLCVLAGRKRKLAKRQDVIVHRDVLPWLHKKNMLIYRGKEHDVALKGNKEQRDKAKAFIFCYKWKPTYWFAFIRKYMKNLHKKNADLVRNASKYFLIFRKNDNPRSTERTPQGGSFISIYDYTKKMIGINQALRLVVDKFKWFTLPELGKHTKFWWRNQANLWIEGHGKVAQCLFKQTGHPNHAKILLFIFEEEKRKVEKARRKAFYLANKEWIDEKNFWAKKVKELKKRGVNEARVV